jgi:hypothetical protein
MTSVKIEFEHGDIRLTGSSEIQWILDEVAAQIIQGRTTGTIRNAEGGAIGAWMVRLPKPEGTDV